MGSLHSYLFYTASSTGGSLAALTAKEAQIEPYSDRQYINVVGVSAWRQHTNSALEADIDLATSYAKVVLNTWSVARYPICPSHSLYWLPKSLPANVSADWTVSFNDAVGSLEAAVCVHVAYGIPRSTIYQGVTARVVTASGDIGTTSGDITQIGTITDLDSRKNYQLIGGRLYHEDDQSGCGYCQITSPSMDGKKVSFRAAEALFDRGFEIIPNGFRPNILGLETIIVSVMEAGGAEKPTVILLFGETTSPGEESGEIVAPAGPSVQSTGGGSQAQIPYNVEGLGGYQMTDIYNQNQGNQGGILGF